MKQKKPPRYEVLVTLTSKVNRKGKAKFLSQNREVDICIPCRRKKKAMRIAEFFVYQGYVDVMDNTIKDDWPSIYCNY